MDIFFLLQKALQYDFIQKALVCGVLIAVTSSLLGVFLVLRKLSLISDGLSHVSFAAVAISLFFGLTPLFASIPIVILASLAITKLSEKANMYSDSAIGLVSALSIATGVIIISVNRGFNIDIYSYLFGSILAISGFEVTLSVIISVIVIAIIFIFFNELFLITYDEDYASISKIKLKTVNLTMSIIQSVTIVIGVKIVGAMLMSSLIIFPAVSSLQLAKNFRHMIALSVSISVISVVSGIFLSFLLNTPTGATIVVTNGFIFAVFFSINKIFKIK